MNRTIESMPMNVRRQIADSVLLIRPTRIRFNPQTASDNRFQQQLPGMSVATIRAQANLEFDRFFEQLCEAGVRVVVPEIDDDFDTPDAVFPNNWVSFHEDGCVVLYPMRAPNRRLERRTDIIGRVQMSGYVVGKLRDFSTWEQEELYLEGTGSLVLDRVHRKAFACLSPRTSEEAVRRWCSALEFDPIVFRANHQVDGSQHPIYHTNVMMGIGETFAVVCLESIGDRTERATVQDSLASTGRTVVEIDGSQMNQFAGNVIQLLSHDDVPVTVVSQTAFECLHPDQRHALSCGSKMLVAEIDCIEACGGGSVRCMIAEIFLPRIPTSA